MFWGTYSLNIVIVIIFVILVFLVIFIVVVFPSTASNVFIIILSILGVVVIIGFVRRLWLSVGGANVVLIVVVVGYRAASRGIITRALSRGLVVIVTVGLSV